MEMKSIKSGVAALVAGFAVLAVAPAVHAADLSGGGYDQHTSASSLWNGYYGGLNVGYGQRKSSARVEGANANGAAIVNAGIIPSSLQIGADGVVLGGQVGYNRQHGNWVYGVEIDLSYAHLTGAETFTSAFPTATTLERTINWLGTVRGRAGMLVHPGTLVYATGGLAFGETTAHMAFSIPAAAACIADCGENTTSKMSVGWTVGAGLEHSLNNWASIRTEYLYVDLGKQNVRVTDSFNPAFVFNSTFHNTANIFRSSMNFKF